MNTTGFLTCPCCGEKLVVNYDDISGFSINDLYLSQKLNEKITAIQQNNMMLKFQAAQQERMNYLLNNLSQCCTAKGDSI